MSAKWHELYEAYFREKIDNPRLWVEEILGMGIDGEGLQEDLCRAVRFLGKHPEDYWRGPGVAVLAGNVQESRRNGSKKAVQGKDAQDIILKVKASITQICGDKFYFDADERDDRIREVITSPESTIGADRCLTHHEFGFLSDWAQKHYGYDPQAAFGRMRHSVTKELRQAEKEKKI